MSSSEEKKRPFMYIHQPYIEVNEVNNQEVYISKGKKQRIIEDIPDIPNISEIQPEVEQEQPVQKRRKPFSIPPLSPVEEISSKEHVVEKTDIQPKEVQGMGEMRKVKPQFSRKRPFRELTIDEKIAYIENYPTQLPPVSCFYKLKDKTVQGKLEGISSTHLELIKNNGNKEVIKIEEIVDIMLPGLG